MCSVATNLCLDIKVVTVCEQGALNASGFTSLLHLSTAVHHCAVQLALEVSSLVQAFDLTSHLIAFKARAEMSPDSNAVIYMFHIYMFQCFKHVTVKSLGVPKT